MKPSPIFAPKLLMTTSVDGIDNNFLDDKFLVFAYRYKHADNFYTAPSSWTRVAFEPSLFQLDYQTSENNGISGIRKAANIPVLAHLRDHKKLYLRTVYLIVHQINTL